MQIGSDTLVGTAVASPFSADISTTGLIPGATYTYYAIAVDNQGAPSASATTTSTIQNVAAHITLSSAGSTISNGQQAAITFGSLQQGQSGAVVTFTVQNVGQASLTLGTPSVPSGFVLATAPATAVAVGASTTFSIQLLSTVIGTYSGAVTFATNDPSNPNFQFPITGTVVASGSTVTLQPGPVDGQDIWVCSDYYGGGQNDADLRVGGWGDSYYALLKFDLAGLPANASSAVLYLYNWSNNGGTPTAMNLEQITSSWDTSTKWTAKPNVQSVTALAAPTVGSWFSIDLTSLYKQWQAGTVPNYGIELQPAATSQNFDFFYSANYLGDSTLRPKLVISAPTTATMTTVVSNGPNPASFNQPLSFVTSVTAGVPDGETVKLEDGSNNNAVVASATLSGGSAKIQRGHY